MQRVEGKNRGGGWKNHVGREEEYGLAGAYIQRTEWQGGLID